MSEAAWTEMVPEDPTGEQALILPVVVESCELPRYFRNRKPIDLTGTAEEEVARRLIEGCQTERRKPIVRPRFPLNRPAFPADALPGFPSTIDPGAARSRTPKAIRPVFVAAQLDKDDQATHILDHIPPDPSRDRRKTFGFLVGGAEVHWPQAINFKAAYGLQEPGAHSPEPEVRPLKHQESRSRLEPQDYLWRLVAKDLDCRPAPTAIARALSRPPSKIFYRELSNAESERPELLRGLLAAWCDLPLAKGAPIHLLILIVNEAGDAGTVRTGTLMDEFMRLTDEAERHAWLLPPLRPATRVQADDWLKYHVAESIRDDVRLELDAAFAGTLEIPHGVLRDRLVAVLNRSDP